ncbi:MAG: PfkB family carbohydrate kinase [Pseudomonadota bacterium]
MVQNSVTCIGAFHWDTVAHATHSLDPGADVPGVVRRSPGGVAYNVANELIHHGFNAQLLSVVGRDSDGDALLNLCALRGIDTDMVIRHPTLRTDQYVAIEGRGGALFGAIADTLALDEIGISLLDPLRQRRFNGVVVVDGNLSPHVLAELAAASSLRDADMRVVPASPDKAPRLRDFLVMTECTIYANLAEANAILNGEHAQAEAAARDLAALGARMAVVTNGSASAAIARSGLVYSATPPPVIAGSVTGAGDAFVAGHIAAQLRGEMDWNALKGGLQSAARHMERYNQ